MLIDTHAHLNFKAFKKDLDGVIQRALKADVEKIIIPGAKLDSSREAIKIAQEYPSCFAAIGIHPHHATNYSSLAEIFSLAKQPKVVAIGEIGLDYYRYSNHPPISKLDKQTQKNLFCLQLELATEINLPVIIHCRQAYVDLLDILRAFLKNSKKITGVFHCFEGEKEHLFTVFNLGFYVGYDGNITYPENQHLRNLVNLTPADRLLLETDSPFLTPVPLRGSRNEPAYLPYIAAKVAEIQGKKSTTVAKITSDNALKLFNL